MSRVTSPHGVDFVGRWEGCILTPYKDVAGILTVGFGHVIRAGEPRTGITRTRALELLAADLALAEDAVNERVVVALTQNQFDALVSFTFNAGTGALASSTLLARLNRGEHDAVPAELLRWDKRRDPATGHLVIDAGLHNRRASEGALWATPDAADASPATRPTGAALSDSERDVVLALVYGAGASLAYDAVTEAMDAGRRESAGLPPRDPAWLPGRCEA